MMGDPYRYGQESSLQNVFLGGYCHHGQKLKAAGWGATGWTRVLRPQRGPGSALGSPTSLQASPGPVCKVGTLSLGSGGSLSSIAV